MTAVTRRRPAARLQKREVESVRDDSANAGPLDRRGTSAAEVRRKESDVHGHAREDAGGWVRLPRIHPDDARGVFEVSSEFCSIVHMGRYWVSGWSVRESLLHLSTRL